MKEKQQSKEVNQVEVTEMELKQMAVDLIEPFSGSSKNEGRHQDLDHLPGFHKTAAVVCTKSWKHV